jgi:Sensors of blue-light using FAD
MLSQLVYVSNRASICSDEEIENILASCKKNNPELEITGVLLYSDTKFIQLVEGEYKTIFDLYDKLKGDPRHHDFYMISCVPIKERAFPSWHMGSKKFSNSEVDFKTDILEEDKKIFDQILQGQEENGSAVLHILKKFF